MYIQTNRGLGQVTSPEGGAPLNPPPRPLTEREVMLVAKSAGDTWRDKRGNIDVFAQKSIVRLSKNRLTAAEAHGLLDAVKSRELRGIFIENQKVPALRAQKLIPVGEDAVFLLAPASSSEPPLITFRDTVKANPSRLDPALLKAWASYRLWKSGQLIPCGQIPGISVRNVVPQGFCQVKDQLSLPYCPSPPTSNGAFTKWLQASLNRVLGTRLSVDGIFGVQTRRALNSFQRSKSLISNGLVDRSTQKTLEVASGFPVPCKMGGCYICELPKGVGVCCYKNENIPPDWIKRVPECFELAKRLLDSCQDSHDECLRKAQCAQCQCIGEKLGKQYCQCTGIV